MEKGVENTFLGRYYTCAECAAKNIFLDQMKTEIAQEFGVQLGADTVSRANGSVGGEITKRLVQTAQQQFGGMK